MFAYRRTSTLLAFTALTPVFAYRSTPTLLAFIALTPVFAKLPSHRVSLSQIFIVSQLQVAFVIGRKQTDI